MGHAVLRAIGMVGQKRRIVDRQFAAAAAAKPAKAADGTAPHGESPVAAVVDDVPLSGADTPSSDGTRTSSPAPVALQPRPVVRLPPRPPPPPELIPVPEADAASATPFLDLPLTPIERACFARPALAARGYLCLNLEMYVTHEPCVMCSMALLHSRFGRVVFWRAMPRTGALAVERLPEPAELAAAAAAGAAAGKGGGEEAAGREERAAGGKLAKTPEQQQKHEEKQKAQQEKQREREERRQEKRPEKLQQPKQSTRGPQQAWPASSSYGLFWRPQLNWKFPCWQWRPDPNEALRIMTGGGLDGDARRALHGLRRLRIEEGVSGESAADEAEDSLDDTWAEPVMLDETTHA